MIDLANKTQRNRLLKAVKLSREALTPFRKVRKELLKDYCGSWFDTTHGASYKTLVNLLNQTAKIYTVALAANNPKVMCSTSNPDNWAFAKRFEVNLNKLISDMNLSRTFRLIVLDAFFSIGCAVVCMRDSDTEFHAFMEGEEDVWIDPGEPWLNRVSTDDLILDMTAKELSKMRYCGHKYRADFKKVQQERGYNKEVRAALTATKRSSTDNDGATRESDNVDDDELKPMIWLQDIWIPENNSVATFACDRDLPPLLVKPWTGRQGGPYKFLSLGLVPDHVMPSSPASNLKGLHDLQNRLHRKMEQQADDQKQVNAYSPHDEEHAKGFRDAKNGDWVPAKNPRDIAQVKLGGVDPGNQAFSLMVEEEYNKIAGNPAARAGLGAQAGTARQEEIIQGNIGQQDADMHLAVLDFATECCTELGALLWHDETIEIQTSMPIEGTDISVDSSWPLLDEWGERVRHGDFDELDLSVEAYSMTYKPPEQKIQEILGTIRELGEFWPMFEASGAVIDVRELLKTVAAMRGRPELLRLITFPGEQQGGHSGEPRQAAHTTRETIRRNIPTGGTAASRSAILQQSLGGGNGQPNNDQMASLSRPPA